ncbi:Aldehyde dehydrogenase, N-terminal [Penicillium italicum]|uniref:Aldehyde dehydrogenase, N-terminal n=1 Tax=Penicillium italicum TaxID=40296 RepID=A0A0A2L4Q1_PENIT|nr:Aldehyde dehydrogenase, N-terminal [Penicillium italicum]
MDTLSILSQLDTLGRATEYLKDPLNGTFYLQNFIENKFLDCEHTSEWIDSFAPRSGKLLLKVPLSPPNVVDYAVSVASRALAVWSRSTPHERSDALFRISSILQEWKELFVVWESLDQGKPLLRARAEVDYSIQHFRYFAEYLLNEEKAVRFNKGLEESTLTYRHRVPVGVFAIITSSHMPLHVLTSKIAACIAFGCTGVAKPSESTSMTAFLLSEVLRQAELPPGVMNIIFGDGPGTGATLAKSPYVQGVSFTGGKQTAIQIRKDTTADIDKRLSFDLRGISPTLVFADVNIDEAASVAAFAAFENSGQLGLAGSRIYVHRSIYKMFLIKFTKYVLNHCRLEKELGPVVSQEQYDNIRSYLIQASEEHAVLEVGKIPKLAPEAGFWVDPTVLTGVSNDGFVGQEEVFGPVATVYSFDKEDEVVRLCNQTPNVMGALVLTDDLSRQRRVGETLDAGLVWAGCWLGRELGAGFTDIRATGLGREGGAHNQDIFTRLRAVHIRSY